MITLKYTQLTAKHDGNVYVSTLKILSEPRCSRCYAGHLQGAILRAHAEAGRGRDGVHQSLRARIRDEARGRSHQEEVILYVCRRCRKIT